jgi:iron complex transport system substrate-binding protein
MGSQCIERAPAPVRVAAALLAFAACSHPAPPQAPPAAGASSPTFPREISLGSGQGLTLRAPPTRVLPASATAVDLVVALTSPERVVALPEQALEYSSLLGAPGQTDAAAWSALPRFEAYTAEQALRFGSDLVLAEPWSSVETHARLREAGVPVLLLPEVRTWRDARALLLALAPAFEAEERARELVRELDARVERLRANAGQRRGLRALNYSNFGSAGYSAGLGTTVDEEMRLAGLTNVLAASGREGTVPITFEELLVLDPDLILVSRPLKMPPGHEGDRGGASERLLLSEPSLAGLRAVRERRIVSLPPWLYATGSHELVRGAEVLAGEVDQLLERLARASRDAVPSAEDRR